MSWWYQRLSIKKAGLISLLIIPFQLATAGGGVAIPDTKNFYLGGNVGKSFLNPETQNTIWKVKDDNDTAFKFYVGYKLTQNWGVEAFYADLGEAKLSSVAQNGKIDYKLAGGGVVYTLRSKNKFNPIFKLGIADINNKSSNINYIQNNNTVTFAGLGVEYKVTRSLRLRAEYEYFDKDMQLFSIGLVWHK